MSVPLSISNSDERMPTRTWRPVLLGAVLIALGWIAVLEVYLTQHGYRATVSDSAHSWAVQRSRASALGEKALVLIGNSRMQLDIHQAALRRLTGKEPVQLAVDSSKSFISPLEGLANDPTIRGTLVIGYVDTAITDAGVWDRASKFEVEFQSSRGWRAVLFHSVEPVLEDAIRSSMASFGDGARPITTIYNRVVSSDSIPQYLLTLPDRSILADYSRVSVQDAYYSRIERDMDGRPQLPDGATYADLDNALQRQVAAIEPVDNTNFLVELVHVESLVRLIQARGGRVIFVVLPSSGMEREIERRRFPRKLFWDKFVESTSAQTIHFEDDATMSQFVCPDGSHLDFRQRESFTVALTRAMEASESRHVN
jgi:hypothetical protein